MSATTPTHESLINGMLDDVETMIESNDLDGAWSKLKTVDNMPGGMTDNQGGRWMRLVDNAHDAEEMPRTVTSN